MDGSCKTQPSIQDTAWSLAACFQSLLATWLCRLRPCCTLERTCSAKCVVAQRRETGCTTLARCKFHRGDHIVLGTGRGCSYRNTRTRTVSEQELHTETSWVVCSRLSKRVPLSRCCAVDGVQKRRRQPDEASTRGVRMSRHPRAALKASGPRDDVTPDKIFDDSWG